MMCTLQDQAGPARSEDEDGDSLGGAGDLDHDHRWDDDCLTQTLANQV